MATQGLPCSSQTRTGSQNWTF